MQQNNDLFPWDQIPDSNVFPTMTGRFSWDLLEDGTSQKGKRMFRARFTCVEPQIYAGMSHFENMVTGSDENLMGIVPGSMGTRALKGALKAAQIASNSSISQMCGLVNASHPQLLISLSKYTESDGEYAGQERNRIVAYHKIGERQVQIAPVVGSPGSGGSGNGYTIPTPPAAPAMTAMAAPMAPAPAPPIATPAPAPVQAAPIPQQAPPISAPAAPVAPVQQVAPAAPSSVQGVPCALCAQKGKMVMVLPTDLSAHVQRHMQDPNFVG